MRISASEPVQLWLQGLPPGTKQRVRRELKAMAVQGEWARVKPTATAQALSWTVAAGQMIEVWKERRRR